MSSLVMPAALGAAFRWRARSMRGSLSSSSTCTRMGVGMGMGMGMGTGMGMGMGMAGLQPASGLAVGRGPC